MSAFYCDSSALVPLLLTDLHSVSIGAWLASSPKTLIVSDFAAAEVSAAISRRIRTREIDVEIARTALGTFDEWRRRSTTRRLTSPGDIAACERLVRRSELKLQAPDALHIAIALADGATLVTFDERLAQAMAGLGPCVVPT